MTGNLEVLSVGRLNYIAYPNDGFYHLTTDPVTGILKIKLPQGWSSTMMKFTVSIYNYRYCTSNDYIISGYNYLGSPCYWTCCNAVEIGHAWTHMSNLPVIFGTDGDRCCVYIGNADTVWSYPMVQIKDIIVGFSVNYYANWNTGWEMSFISALDNVSDMAVTIPNTNMVSSAFSLSGTTLTITT